MFQIDFAVFFDMQSAPHAFFLLGLNVNTADFFVISNIVLASEWTTSRNQFVL